jgi:hypothetical protein
MRVMQGSRQRGDRVVVVESESIFEDIDVKVQETSKM